MGQLNESQYLKLNPYYGRSDGVFVEKATGDIVIVIDGTIVGRYSASGGGAAITLAEGSVLVGDATNTAAAVDASASGQILVGDGTTLASVAVSGDVALAANGAATVTDLTITNEARGDLLRRGATAWERVSAKDAGKILVGDGTDVVSVAVSGDATLSSAGVVAIGAEKVEPLMLDHSGRVELFEDFLLEGTSIAAPWNLNNTSLGAEVCTMVADAASGALSAALDATDGVEAVGATWNDQRTIPPANDPVVTFRLQIVGAGGVAAGTSVVFGLASDRNNDPDAIASSAWFKIDGSAPTGILGLLLESDDGVADLDDQEPTTPVTLTHTTYYEFRVEATNHADVKFYYRASLNGAWTELTKAATTFAIHASTQLQPIVQVQKASGTATASILVDYIHTTWTRT